MSALLTVTDLHSHYGKSQALFGVSLAVDAGQVVALLGRNGMGKTTTIRNICRMMRATSGEISFDGQVINAMPSHRAARLGMGLVPEGRRCFAPLSVHENLTAAARPGAWDYAKVVALFPRLGERRDQRADTLSGGEQQMLAIGRALMTNPRLLILDEATEGLAPVIRQEIWAAIRALKAEGLAILLVDKSLREVLGIASHAVILERGSTVWQGAASAVDTGLANRYLGV
ncbi:ABC transporter ATP-binding protein [Abyssibius alkaniclasticus]|uniref:ABC transporter ATP-binding protein n=1 Tax=Abyssibius alkaniclasticus TaxID=2881234 RepID=UPI00405A455C